ncbi:NAD(P)-dependent dehydrogenase (short-subunit alcohol dehydrogenase family) [Rhizobium binae]|uniref:NAD(P)-dependent dehydrogenase (Short-subunit alcohol dehydrogenase family) n=1 Tax=Rhizobium binae TaxID=1138190 RepID=A0ABV2MFN2_9HYPH|nr:oxidoreductase [Rhizobium binae]MBX4994769.1 SDR family NAD(P)-dependent oxidoreductase [Rhizobium binae]NKL49828.1 SDR family NAD(P)-dependent oxidoreductase [Rhizobium leguminosarum bv. viciae]QSY85301.1 SDR family NAD(P)-dependent oxidoreductase [Rhizobium binae]
MRTWFITGANRGLGLEIARAALEAGDTVTATARDPQQIVEALEAFADSLHTVPLDVTDHAAVDKAVNAAKERFGRIDVLVNNAGYGQLGAFEEIAPETVSRQFATNVFGVFDVTRAVLPMMRAQRSGHVITISSIAGMQGFEGSSIYCATKHAVSGWSEGLAREVAPFGIKVTCVYPGRFRTDFLDGSSVRYGDFAIEDYAAASARRRQALDADNHQQIGDPRKFAAAMLALVKADNPPVWLATGSDAYAVFDNKSATLAENIEHWKDLVLSTDF